MNTDTAKPETAAAKRQAELNRVVSTDLRSQLTVRELKRYQRRNNK